MFIFGACYLWHRPQQGPEFLQYLYHILDDNKNYKWPAVAEYDRNFRYFRQNNPSFSWATINTTFHNTLNKVFNQRAVVNPSSFDQENRRQGHGNRHYGQNSQGAPRQRSRSKFWTMRAFQHGHVQRSMQVRARLRLLQKGWAHWGKLS